MPLMCRSIMFLKEWEVIDQITLGSSQLQLFTFITTKIVNEMKIMDLIATLKRMYEKLSASNKVFLVKRLFNMKMVSISQVGQHLYNFIYYGKLVVFD